MNRTYLSSEEIKAICAGDQDSIMKMVIIYRKFAIAACSKRAIALDIDLDPCDKDEIVQNVMIKLVTRRLKDFRVYK